MVTNCFGKPILHKPVDLSGGKRPTQAHEQRYGAADIAQGTWADQQNRFGIIQHIRMIAPQRLGDRDASSGGLDLCLDPADIPDGLPSVKLRIPTCEIRTPNFGSNTWRRNQP